MRECDPAGLQPVMLLHQLLLTGGLSHPMSVTAANPVLLQRAARWVGAWFLMTAASPSVWPGSDKDCQLSQCLRPCRWTSSAGTPGWACPSSQMQAPQTVTISPLCTLTLLLQPCLWWVQKPWSPVCCDVFTVVLGLPGPAGPGPALILRTQDPQRQRPRCLGLGLTL